MRPDPRDRLSPSKRGSVSILIWPWPRRCWLAVVVGVMPVSHQGFQKRRMGLRGGRGIEPQCPVASQLLPRRQGPGSWVGRRSFGDWDGIRLLPTTSSNVIRIERHRMRRKRTTGVKIAPTTFCAVRQGKEACLPSLQRKDYRKLSNMQWILPTLARKEDWTDKHQIDGNWRVLAVMRGNLVLHYCITAAMSHLHLSPTFVQALSRINIPYRASTDPPCWSAAPRLLQDRVI